MLLFYFILKMWFESKEMKFHGLSLPGFVGAGRQDLSKTCFIPCDNTGCRGELALAQLPYSNQTVCRWALGSVGIYRWVVLAFVVLGGR